MTAELYLGSCEQFKYTVVAPTKKLLHEKFKAIMCFNRKLKRHRFRKMPPLHRPGYAMPDGAVHYKVDGYRGTILVIYKD